MTKRTKIIVFSAISLVAVGGGLVVRRAMRIQRAYESLSSASPEMKAVILREAFAGDELPAQPAPVTVAAPTEPAPPPSPSPRPESPSTAKAEASAQKAAQMRVLTESLNKLTAAPSAPAAPIGDLSSALGGAGGVSIHDSAGRGSAGTLGTKGIGIGGGGVGYGKGAGMAAAPAKRAEYKLQNGFVMVPQPDAEGDEGYRNYGVNPFIESANDRLSTFSIDVDTASYTIARRKILEGQLPPKDSVRVEEFVNYFRYDYPAPQGGAPFAVTMEAAPSPFTKGRHLLRVGLQGKKVSLSERRSAHLVFLVDVSGSMQSPDKLPLAKRALRMLVDNLRDGDTVALVTYAGGVREVLAPTGLEKKAEIHAAIESLTAGGSTAMASGIELAYRNAARTISADSVSRVIILSDGDANVGPTSHNEMLKTIAGHVKEGVTLSVCGFGMGNYKDDLMEQFADKGNGNYAYIDSLLEAKRVFQEQLGGTLEVIAQDTKIQVDFDPEYVTRYRLVGYENRDIADRDFRNDKVDAGEIGSGHSVTALYEVELTDAAKTGALATVRVRAKKPRGEKADEWAFPFAGEKLAKTFDGASSDFRFAVAVMGAAEIFRQSRFARDWSMGQIERIARAASPSGNHERQEFLHLLERASGVVGAVARVTD